MMRQDPEIRREAEGILDSLFSSIGRASQDSGSANALGGMGVQIAEFVQMPMELAEIFVSMSMDLTKMVLESLAEAGIVLVRGLSPM